MPYETIQDLPPGLKGALPPHAQRIYLSAFNHAWQNYTDRPAREKTAHRVAWAAVKRFYEKDPRDDGWVRKKFALLE